MLCGFIAQAQHFKIRGVVVSDETQEPLQGASVFMMNTTLGTVTDDKGNFEIVLPNGGYDVVVTFSGKQSESRRITTSDGGEKLSFSLKNKEKELQEVAVVSSSEVKDGWNVYGNFFIDNFIGNTPNAKQTVITNPEVLKFYYSKRKNKLKVIADAPLSIQNNALGYTIRYELDSFVYNYANHTSLFEGDQLFTPIQTSDSAQITKWNEARANAYKGSILHFMRSYANKELEENGFEVRSVTTVKGVEKTFRIPNPYITLNYQKNDSLQLVILHPKNPELGILYTKEKPESSYSTQFPEEPSDFQYSQISLPAEGLFIESNGYYYDQYDLLINGYWNWTKLADMLPYNYQP